MRNVRLATIGWCVGIVMLLFGQGVARCDAPPTFVLSFGSYGIGSSQFGSPVGIGVDAFGRVHVADTNKGCILEFDASGMYLESWGSAGSGPGQFRYPIDVAFDAAGMSYVFDGNGPNAVPRVLRFDSGHHFVDAWDVPGAVGIAIGDSALYAVGGFAILKYSLSGQLLTTWSNVALAGRVAVGPTGMVYVLEPYNGTVGVFTSSGTFVRRLGSFGNGDGQMTSADGIAVDATERVYVTEEHRCQVFGADGSFAFAWGQLGSGPGQFTSPVDIAIDASDTIYILDQGNGRVQKFVYGATPVVRSTLGRLKQRYR
jgi:tripartite motif-containing protein 71